MQPSDLNYHLPPFPAFPSTSRYVPLGSVDEALARICRSIEAGEAISLVIGPPGTGKSLLCGLIAQRYRSSHDVVVMGETRLEDRNAFLRHLLHHLQVDMSRVRDGDLQLAVMERVCGDESAEGGLLIVVDEAQSLSAEVLEAIRMVTNIMRHGVPLVSAVICGGVKLDDLLVDASMEAFTQRVATRCYLHPLNREETGQYICETIRRCGANPGATINDAAIATIHHACSGVPRLINQLMTQAIDCAEESDQAMISEKVIDRAWSQLQQLPSPMVDEPRMRRESTNVEFGELDETESFATELSEEIAEAATDDSVFGEFEMEEDIAVGTGVSRQPHRAAEPPANLEQALHHEIVGLNHCLAEMFHQPEETNSFIDAEESLDVTIFEDGESQEVSEEYLSAVDDEESIEERLPQQQATSLTEPPSPTVANPDEIEQREEAKPLHSIQWFSGQEPASDTDVADTDPGTIGRDDSDLLVIEDEIEVCRVDAAKQYDSLDQTISVDFQAMLSRMRSGSNS